MSERAIILRGVAVNNLRKVDLDIPHHELVTICGVSGSGKTSLALDTLYAEGQRRYIESFSAYTRQFLEKLDKPNAERIDGIPPAIAVTHKNPSRSNRATVGTTTEVNDYLSILFARAGDIECYRCRRHVRRDTPEGAAVELERIPDGRKLLVCCDVSLPKDERPEELISWLLEGGFIRAIVDGIIQPIDSILSEHLSRVRRVTVVLDRLTTGASSVARLKDSLETAFRVGDGFCRILVERPQNDSPAENTSSQANHGAVSDDAITIVDGRTWYEHRFSRSLSCEWCNIDYPDPVPDLFNFNKPLGACPVCEGFGNIATPDMSKIIPDPQKSIREGAIAPWNSPAYKHELSELLALAGDYGLPVDVPASELEDRHLRLITEGVPERGFGGLNGFFKWLEKRKYKMHLRVFLSRWRSYFPCPGCHGMRLKPEALSVRFGEKNFGEIARMEIREASDWIESLEVAVTRDEGISRLVQDVASRLSYLQDVGVGYLQLERSLRTLSAGEAQRVALTATLGSSLVEMLYVLDEPSVGLHPADVEPLASAVAGLAKRGNTVVTVEHEPLFIRIADRVVELGPGAGDDGGQITFQGSPVALESSAGSRTGDWLAGRRQLRSHTRRATQQGWIKIRGARGNNLKNLSAEFPLGVLCLVTGVSGSGKSTLVQKTLYPALRRRTLKDFVPGTLDEPLEFDDLLGSGQIEDVELVDQSPIGRSPRSNPATYIKALDPIREIFAEVPEARARRFTASHFSFNVEGGRCEVCKGDGYLAIDMQFMADVFIRCSECEGRRYRRDVLEVRYRGMNISEVLGMTAREAFTFFRGSRKVQVKLKSLLDVGLDYLKLGQPATTLSGGEAQRLKLAQHLSANRRGRTLFLLDEPTTGLHFSDVVQLMDCFEALLEVGHSLIVIEHNLQLITAADYIIDLGPGAAGSGGRIVARGTPEEVAANRDSLTGRFISRELAVQSR